MVAIEDSTPKQRVKKKQEQETDREGRSGERKKTRNERKEETQMNWPPSITFQGRKCKKEQTLVVNGTR